jgi:transposase-like protein
VIRLWDNAWAEFIPFLDYDVETRRVICSTNAIESLTAARSRPADTFPPSRPH